MSTYGSRDSGGTGQWIMGAVTRNPEGLLLLAAGAALLMRTGRNQTRSRRYTDAFTESRGGRQQFGQQVGEAARRAGEFVSEAKDKVSETARSYVSAAAEYADDAARVAADQSRRTADQARETAEYVVREQPWAVALAGLVAGATVAAIFPSTPIERRAFGEVGQRLRSAADSVGEQLMDAGMQAGERLSEVAEERGLTREGLEEAAREVGDTFSSALAGEKPEASPQAKRQGSERTQTRQGGGPQSGGRQAGTERTSDITPSGGRR
jgi:ElaB/YqjD/DUF883 family membrane-anchored ribosome-binding protein